MGSEYSQLGVDVSKKGIEVFLNLVDNIYPNAFCVVSQHPAFPHQGLVLHTDSAGSKPVQSYLNWKETEDLKAFQSLTQDVIAMNIDDLVCVGAIPISFIDYIAVNPFAIPKSPLLEVLGRGFHECLQWLRQQQVSIRFGGGETADLPDTVRTLDISGAVFGITKLENTISGEQIESGNKIIGLRSGGQTKDEPRENSGIMCNGITLARHALMKKEYTQQYPETQHNPSHAYKGQYSVDHYSEDLGMCVGEAITSPTRLYTPSILRIIERYGNHVRGLIHNTGGGQTKCLQVGQGIHYRKQSFFVDPIFQIIQRESGEQWRTMFQNFNMGTGFEVIVDEEVAEDILSVPEKEGLEAQIIGQCELSKGKNLLTLETPWGTFQYL
jgi:phosphoribosylformylglycinamidine cyclo-ligase